MSDRNRRRSLVQTHGGWISWGESVKAPHPPQEGVRVVSTGVRRSRMSLNLAGRLKERQSIQLSITGGGRETPTNQIPGPVCGTWDLILMVGAEPDEAFGRQRAASSDLHLRGGQKVKPGGSQTLTQSKGRSKIHISTRFTCRWAEQHRRGGGATRFRRGGATWFKRREGPRGLRKGWAM